MRKLFSLTGVLGLAGLPVLALCFTSCSGAKFETQKKNGSKEGVSALNPKQSDSSKEGASTGAGLNASDAASGESASISDAGALGNSESAGESVSQSGLMLEDPQIPGKEDTAVDSQMGITSAGGAATGSGGTTSTPAPTTSMSEPSPSEPEMSPADTMEPDTSAPVGTEPEPVADPQPVMDAMVEPAPAAEPAVEPVPAPPPCDGVLYEDICWYHGALDDSCATTCESHGGPHPDAASVVGTTEQGGSPEQCKALLELLGIPGEPVTAVADYAEDGFGCHTFGDSDTPRWLSAPPYDPTSNGRRARLICGCVE